MEDSTDEKILPKLIAPVMQSMVLGALIVVGILVVLAPSGPKKKDNQILALKKENAALRVQIDKLYLEKSKPEAKTPARDPLQEGIRNTISEMADQVTPASKRK